jgi:HEAT repeat protein
VFAVVLLLVSAALPLWAQPSLPKDSIPQDVPAEVRAAIQGLYASDPLAQVEAADKLAEMGERAIPAVPFLVSMLRQRPAARYDWEDYGEWYGADEWEEWEDWYEWDWAPTNPRTAAREALEQLGAVAVPKLAEVMRDRKFSGRGRAAQALGRIGTLDAIGALLAGLGDGDPLVRVQAITALQQHNEPRVVVAVAKLLKDPDPRVAAAAAGALGSLRDGDTVGLLIEALKDDDPRVRAAAANTLGSIRDGRAAQPLIGLLTDAEPRVRVAALNALTTFEDRRARQPIVESLKDGIPSVREAALRVVGGGGSRRAQEFLLGALQDTSPRLRSASFQGLERRRWSSERGDKKMLDPLALALTDRSDSVRLAAMGLAQQIGTNARFVEPLLASAKHPNPEVRAQALEVLTSYEEARCTIAATDALEDPSLEVRAAAAKLLSEKGAVEALSAALQDSCADVRAAAIGGLGQHGADEVLAPLLAALKDPSPEVRAGAAIQLGQLGDDRALEPLLALTGDMDVGVRVAVVSALRESTDHRAEEAIKNALEDDNQRVRRAAASGMAGGGFGGARAAGTAGGGGMFSDF